MTNRITLAGIAGVALTMASLPVFNAAAAVVSNGSLSVISGPGDIDLSGQFTTANGLYGYAVAVGNSTDCTIAGVTFLRDTVAIPGYSVSGSPAQPYGGNTPAFGASADQQALNALCHYNRYGGNQTDMDFTFTVTPGHTYKLQALIWENYFTAPQRLEDILIGNTLIVTGVTVPVVTYLDTIADLGGASLSAHALLYANTWTAAGNTLYVRMAYPRTNRIEPIVTAFTLTDTIPEPATFGLLALGGLALLRRRK